jgi:hypothetical protein
MEGQATAGAAVEAAVPRPSAGVLAAQRAAQLRAVPAGVRECFGSREEPQAAKAVPEAWD